ncbi:hypothetical protein HaLaN_09538 [Haematococcus lacustris]|uniref:Uncharacterized protein n=1 Tax=Haematococcus lacustris TaxID=44745 RepID=A0A699YTY0_HAELA|nr:hypothetical protein HaLaN_09538 [Haematococcus lacustris]
MFYLDTPLTDPERLQPLPWGPRELWRFGGSSAVDNIHNSKEVKGRGDCPAARRQAGGPSLVNKHMFTLNLRQPGAQPHRPLSECPVP